MEQKNLMKEFKRGLVLTLILGAVGATGLTMVAPRVLAAETTANKVQDAATSAKNSVKKTAREAQDKTCETVNGKVQCTAKKAKHGVQNASDSLQAKAQKAKRNYSH